MARDANATHQREVIDAFLAAIRDDFDALLALLDPDVVIRATTLPYLRALREKSVRKAAPGGR